MATPSHLLFVGRGPWLLRLPLLSWQHCSQQAHLLFSFRLTLSLSLQHLEIVYKHHGKPNCIFKMKVRSIAILA